MLTMLCGTGLFMNSSEQVRSAQNQVTIPISFHKHSGKLSPSAETVCMHNRRTLAHSSCLCESFPDLTVKLILKNKCDNPPKLVNPCLGGLSTKTKQLLLKRETQLKETL